MDEPGQIDGPEHKRTPVFLVRHGPLRQSFLVAGVKVREDSPDQGRRLAADVAFWVQKQFVEESQGLLLLRGAPIGEVLLKNSEVCPQPGPVLFTPGGFQHVAEQLIVAQAVHQTNVVVHRHPAQGSDHFLRPHEGHIFFRHGCGGRIPQRDVYAERAEIFLKIPEFGVDEPIAAALFGIDIVQLTQNHVEGLGQRVDPRRLPAKVVPALFDPKIGVDQHQRLRGQVLDLQIPDGVVGGDPPDGGESPAGEPPFGVVVVQIGDPLAGPAAEFAQIVARRRAGDEREVDQSATRRKGAGDRHGHVVDAGDMLQGAEGRNLQPQAQQFIDVLLPEPQQKLPVFLLQAAVRQLLLRAEGEVVPGIKRQIPPLLGQQHPQDV